MGALRSTSPSAACDSARCGASATARSAEALACSNEKPSTCRWKPSLSAAAIWANRPNLDATAVAEANLKARGYLVQRNKPYAGGFITEHYGHPASHVHALQVEINRSVYMSEATFEKGPRFQQLAEDLTAMAQALSDCADGLAGWRAAAE